MPIFEITITAISRVASSTKEKALEDAFRALISDKLPHNVFKHEVDAKAKNIGPTSDEILEEASYQLRLFE